MRRLALIGGAVVLAWLAWWVWLDPAPSPEPGSPVAGPGRPAADQTVAPPPPAPDLPPVSGMPRNSLPVAEPAPATPAAQLRLVRPADGARVSSPLTVEATLIGMRLVAAGVDEPNAGHLHVLVDTGPPAAAGPIPSDPHHVDWGSGEATGEIDLPPGRHTLQLLLGDGSHVPHRPPVLSERVSVIVEPTTR